MLWMIDYQGRTQMRSCNPYSVKTWQDTPANLSSEIQDYSLYSVMIDSVRIAQKRSCNPYSVKTWQDTPDNVTSDFQDYSLYSVMFDSVRIAQKRKRNPLSDLTLLNSWIENNNETKMRKVHCLSHFGFVQMLHFWILKMKTKPKCPGTDSGWSPSRIAAL
jgi:hypothetical protein